jgi:hypothetical protein
MATRSPRAASASAPDTFVSPMLIATMILIDRMFETDYQNIAWLGKNGQLMQTLLNLALILTACGENGEYCAIVYPYQEDAIRSENAALVKS